MTNHLATIFVAASAALTVTGVLAQDVDGGPASTIEADVEELQHSYFLYRSAVDDGMYGEADTLAKRVIELAISLHGIDSHEAAIALTNLGVVQHKQEDYESAQRNYVAAIEIIERIEDRLHDSLVPALKGLGASQLAAGRPDLARQAFDRAVHVTHVNEGPHNLMQIPVLDALAATYVMVGEYDEAEDIQKHIYYLQMRDVEFESEGAIPALQTQADWSHRLSLFERERKSYRQMIKILERSRGPGDLSLIDPLTRLGNTYLHGGSDARTYAGDDYLKRALHIAEESPESGWRDRSDAMLALADYYNLIGQTAAANDMYVAAWEFLGSDDDRMAERQRQLESLASVREGELPRYYVRRSNDIAGARSGDFQSGTIIAAYSVAPDGRTENIRIVDASPEGLSDMEYKVRRQISRMIHRPRIDEGAVTWADDVTYAHDFLYREKDLPQSQKVDLIVDPATEQQ